jgi:hypothetical protein
MAWPSTGAAPAATDAKRPSRMFSQAGMVGVKFMSFTR